MKVMCFLCGVLYPVCLSVGHDITTVFSDRLSWTHVDVCETPVESQRFRLQPWNVQRHFAKVRVSLYKYSFYQHSYIGVGEQDVKLWRKKELTRIDTVFTF